MYCHDVLCAVEVILFYAQLTEAMSVKINTVRLTRHVGFSCDTAVMGLIPPEIAEEDNWSEKVPIVCLCFVGSRSQVPHHDAE